MSCSGKLIDNDWSELPEYWCRNVKVYRKTMNPNRNLNIDMNDIIVVDDEIANLQLLTNILSEAGYRVRPVDKPQLALKSAFAQPPDLVLLDIRMPGMDGYEVCRKLKQNELTRDIPVIIVSALQDIEEKVRGFEVGCVDFISKPFQEPEILARVHTHLSLRRITHHLESLVSERTAELSRAYNEIKESELRFRSTFEQAAVGIAHVSLEGKFLLINKKF